MFVAISGYLYLGGTKGIKGQQWVWIQIPPITTKPVIGALSNNTAATYPASATVMTQHSQNPRHLDGQSKAPQSKVHKPLRNLHLHECGQGQSHSPPLPSGVSMNK